MRQKTYRELLNDAGRQLQAVSESARLDAELLLARALDRPRSHLVAWPERHPDPEQEAAFEALLARRRHGEPMAYILGEREFWSLDLLVSPATLVPRPDTEILVETALEKIPGSGPCQVLDLGTGTGAIALALKKERPLADVAASDASAESLKIAQRNADRLGMVIEFRQGDWWQPFGGRKFNVVVSNPPYIAADDPHLQTGDVRFEPRGALVSGDDGLDDLRKIIGGARDMLAPGGWVLVEHGYRQADAVAGLFASAGFTAISCREDFSGNPRVTLGQLP